MFHVPAFIDGPKLQLNTKMDFRYMQTDNTRISKQAIKEKKPTGMATESWESKKEASKK